MHLAAAAVQEASDVDTSLPCTLCPDIALANYCMWQWDCVASDVASVDTSGGRMGLHQDKDESQESLNAGLPVVSFSIGDSCDFAYVPPGKNPGGAEQVLSQIICMFMVGGFD